MSYDEDWPDTTWENRRWMIKETIRPVSVAELKQLGEKRFLVVTDPWCIRYNEFLENNAEAKFYRAEVPEHAEIVYCAERDKGMWFLPEKGMGVIQSKGLEILKGVVDSL